MIRIYDAQFETSKGNAHQHLAKFWWIDDAGNKGTWTRPEAYSFVSSHFKGYVYVSESGNKVTVWAFYNDLTGTKWIQTLADTTTKNNLIELAERHAAGIPNY